MADEFLIGIGSSPRSGGMFSAVVPLLRPALLYADRVIIYSPTMLFAAVMAQIGNATLDDILTMVAHVGQEQGWLSVEEVATLTRELEALSRKKHKNRDEVLRLARLRSNLRRSQDEMASAVERVLMEHGYEEIRPAVEAGLIEVDNLVDVNSGEWDVDALVDAWAERIVGLLTEPGAYPIFDSETTGLLRAMVAEGHVSIGQATATRSRHVPTASALIDRLPSVPSASLAEIIEVRDALADPLRRFRQAVHRLATGMGSSVLDEEQFRIEVGEIWRHQVKPALDELDELIAENRYLSHLARVAPSQVPNMLKMGAIVFGVTSVTDLPVLLAPMASGVEVAVQAAVGRARTRTQIARHQFLFLRDAERELTRG